MLFKYSGNWEYLLAKENRSVEIPKLIIEKGWDYSKWTIRGIMDTDGTLFFSKKTYKQPIYPTLEIRTHSIRLASQITEDQGNRLLK